jgi:hypothetical protein
VWATAQERKMHAIRQRFNLYAGGSLSADVRRFFQLINADEVLGTHKGGGMSPAPTLQCDLVSASR